MIREPVMVNSSIKTASASRGSSHVMFERGRGWGEPSRTLRKWIQTNLYTIRH